MIIETFVLAVLAVWVAIVALPVIAAVIAGGWTWYIRREHARHVARARARLAPQGR